MGRKGTGTALVISNIAAGRAPGTTREPGGFKASCKVPDSPSKAV